MVSSLLSLFVLAAVVSSTHACEHLLRISSEDPAAHEITGTYSIVNRVHNGRPVYSPSSKKKDDM